MTNNGYGVIETKRKWKKIMKIISVSIMKENGEKKSEIMKMKNEITENI